ncbi:MAG: 2OG-Fe(II) oxygenase [Candidatus Puniceispirillales bacterium WSBS_2018_MAG_OTU23]
MRELYQVWSSSLTDAQINAITATAMIEQAQTATIFASKNASADIRISGIRWVAEPWVKDLLWSYVRRANYDAFEVDVENQSEVQFTEYHAAEGGHYDWHQDVHWNGQTASDRKLSVTVQLSAEDDYEGGGFEFDEVKTTADFRSKGTVLVFPSYLRHRVLPVTSGTRRSLVAWFFGPRWK